MPNYFYHGKTPEARRRVLPGYPKDFVFKDYDEYKQYFVGDRIICLLCGKNYRALGIHLQVCHELSVDDYKKKYGILWGKSLICNETRVIHSHNTKERIASGEFNSGTIEEKRKQGMFARKHLFRRKKNLPLHKSYLKENLKEYNTTRRIKFGHTVSQWGKITKKREANRTKRGTPEFKKIMAERPQTIAFIEKYKNYWKGRKQSEEHIRKRAGALKDYHKKLKEKNHEHGQTTTIS